MGLEDLLWEYTDWSKKSEMYLEKDNCMCWSARSPWSLIQPCSLSLPFFKLRNDFNFKLTFPILTTSGPCRSDSALFVLRNEVIQIAPHYVATGYLVISGLGSPASICLHVC